MVDNQNQPKQRGNQTKRLAIILVVLAAVYFLLPRSWFEVPDDKVLASQKPTMTAQTATQSDINQLREEALKEPSNFAARSRYGMALASAGKGDEALIEFQAAERLAPDDPTVYQNLGALYLSAHNFLKADEYFCRILELVPGDGKTHFFRGLANQGMGKHQFALEFFRASVNLSPDFADGWLNLAMEATKDEPEAKILEYVNRYVKLTGHESLGHYVVSGAYKTWHKYDQAAKYAELSVKLEPKNFGYLHNLGQIYSYAKRFEESEKILAEAETLTPKPGIIYSERALNALNMGKFKTSIEYYQKALAANPESGNIHQSLARVYQRLNDTPNATKEEALYREWEIKNKADKSNGH